MKYLLRLLEASSFTAMLVSAHAQDWHFQSEGSTLWGHGSDYSETASGLITMHEAGAVYRTGNDPLTTVTRVDYTFQEVAPGAISNSFILSGSGTVEGSYNGAPYTLSFTIGGGDVVSRSLEDSIRSFAGSVVEYTVSGGGDLNGSHGLGMFGGTLDGVSFYSGGPDIYHGISKTSFDLEIVPEPAPVALIALGAVGFLARRRK